MTYRISSIPYISAPATPQATADVMDDLLESFLALRVLAMLPAALTRVVYRKRLAKLVNIRRRQEDLYLPLVDLWRQAIAGGGAPAYVDTLIELMVPDEQDGKRRLLTDGEVVALVSEFLGAGTEPVSAELHWIMARLVKLPGVQAAVLGEIEAVVGADAEQVDEEALGRLHYLNAVIMETLRMHPTVPVMQRQVTEDDDVALDGQRIPAGTAVKFPVERLARNKAAWADPDEFRPERFLAGGEGEAVNLAVAVPGGQMIRMMPFGVGRRMCPGWSIAVLHLGYFVANLVREFQWAEAEGEIDLQPRLRGLVTVMKRPLRVRLMPLRHNTCY
ncbi:cytochrome P450 89A2 [Brachypodium distachyon]|uniref:cytochrome P450 89A2 n=1 Tax=Brachypodium distachyon TaxID=15368 RepID=UPI00052FE0C3|nr:cytochrome P450 89A2 [Brachypodium distachyon]|eukprot:XP_003571534.2 cytochrome P450 89A2 [Brachypodium distachyon]